VTIVFGGASIEHGRQFVGVDLEVGDVIDADPFSELIRGAVTPSALSRVRCSGLTTQ